MKLDLSKVKDVQALFASLDTSAVIEIKEIEKIEVLNLSNRINMLLSRNGLLTVQKVIDFHGKHDLTLISLLGKKTSKQIQEAVVKYLSNKYKRKVSWRELF